jgi:hypothetical protein
MLLSAFLSVKKSTFAHLEKRVFKPLKISIKGTVNHAHGRERTTAGNE